MTDNDTTRGDAAVDWPVATNATNAADAAAATNAAGATPRRRASVWSLARELGLIVVVTLVLSVLIKSFVVQSFSIPSESMESTLHIGDRVMVSRLVPGVFDLHRGDVVVFKDPGGWLEAKPLPRHGAIVGGGIKALTFVGLLPQDAGQHVIKRVIGVGGDHVACCDADGLVTVNGQPITEPYLKAGSLPSQMPFDEVVPANKLFVLGDNRQHSGDSRFHVDDAGGGFVPVGNVVGTAFAKSWPAADMGWIRNPGSVFAGVPGP